MPAAEKNNCTLILGQATLWKNTKGERSTYQSHEVQTAYLRA